MHIENYGIIGDLKTTALISLEGSIDFMCYPFHDSPTVFAALLDREKGGCFQITSDAKNVQRKQIYIPDTNILITRFLYEDGIGEVMDFMPIETHETTIIRKVTTVKGSLTYHMRCLPRFNYGKKDHRAEHINEKEILFTSAEGISLRLTCSVPCKIIHQDGYAKFTLKEKETAEFILQKPNVYPLTNCFVSTLNYWKNWSRQSTYTGRWREMIIRSALTLKLLIPVHFGATIAAATFGLPEKIGGRKNWDYRFVWIRDASFAVQALLMLGYKHEAKAFMQWSKQLLIKHPGSRQLNPLYKINGNNASSSTIITRFKGYLNSRPVVVGNDAKNQMQLDIYGEFLNAIYMCDKSLARFPLSSWKMLKKHLNWLDRNWDRKDYSIWEIRGKPEKFLYSRLMCWVAFDRAIKLAKKRSFPFPKKWHNTLKKIHLSFYEDFWDRKNQLFTQFMNSQDVDASCLRMPLNGFIKANDPKWISTMKTIEAKLVTDCMVYRYPLSESQLFGLNKGEGTFSACSFWYIECLSRGGQLQKAEFYFDKMLSYANHLGLYAEQLDFKGEQLGNFPQAFTHSSLISAAIDLNRRLDEKKQTLQMESL